MSKSSELDKVAKRYIIDCIDASGYDVAEPQTDAEKVQFLRDTFYSEYGWAAPKMGETNALREWFAGLPSSCTVAFTYHEIEELGRAWGSIAPDAKDSRVDFIVSNWFSFVANKTAQLFRKHCQQEAATMPRFTIKDLRETVARYNRYAMLSGSTYYYREQGRNGYQAVDLYRIEEDGRESCMRMLEGGTPRECAAAIECHHRGHYGPYTHPQKPNRLTRDQALRAVEIAGADITEPFHAQMWDVVDLLTVWAKRTGYRKPRNANGSTGRCFWEHLQRMHRRQTEVPFD